MSQTVMQPLRCIAWATVLLLPALALAAGKAHQHGMLKLDIAIEARKMSMQIESPLDNLVGFERAPRNDVERKRVEAALTKLNAGQDLFAIDPAAGCSEPKVARLTLQMRF